MVSQDLNLRPSASKVIAHQYLRSCSMSKSRSQLLKELKETKARLRQLELEISEKNDPTSWLSKFASRSPITVAAKKHTSSQQSSPKSHPKILLSKHTRFLVGRGTTKSNSCLLWASFCIWCVLTSSSCLKKLFICCINSFFWLIN